MFFHLCKKVLWLAPVLVTGCVTTQDYQARMDARAQENQRLLQEQANKLMGRVEAVELDTQKLRNDMDALRAVQARSAANASDVQALHSALGNLEQRLRALEGSREKDKQELVEVLSKKISQIMGGAPVDTGRKKTGGGKTTTSTSSGGGEYIVKSGETLSGIASAHGVTVSALREANGIKKDNQLRAGQKLVIPK
ncbi:MAG: LysM domain-containing protein [Kiritimatiellaeota bacterium]|nr:LysM domain-containing protein [Kiritimatiellota bacterium]